MSHTWTKRLLILGVYIYRYTPRRYALVLTHILFVIFLILFVFHLHVDVVGPLLLNATPSTTDYSDWLVQVNELFDNWQ